MKDLYPETRAEVQEEIDRIDRHLLTISADSNTAKIYRKLRDDLAAELKKAENQ